MRAFGQTQGRAMLHDWHPYYLLSVPVLRFRFTNHSYYIGFFLVNFKTYTEKMEIIKSRFLLIYV